MLETKEKITNTLLNIIQKKILSIKDNINLATESRNESTKSSAGDKHETSRALIQIEIDNYSEQLNKALIQKNELQNISLTNKKNKVEIGSLVVTSHGIYFIGLGWGQLKIDNTIYFCISLASPIGKILKDQKTGSTLKFLNKKITINEIY